MKDQFKKFKDKAKKYVLCKFDNPRDIIIVVRDLKDPYAHIDMDKPINLINEDNEIITLVTQLEEEEKYYMNMKLILKNSVPKLYGILWGQYTLDFKNEFQGDPGYDTNPYSFGFLLILENLNLNA